MRIKQPTVHTVFAMLKHCSSAYSYDQNNFKKFLKANLSPLTEFRREKIENLKLTLLGSMPKGSFSAK